MRCKLVTGVQACALPSPVVGSSSTYSLRPGARADPGGRRPRAGSEAVRAGRADARPAPGRRAHAVPRARPPGGRRPHRARDRAPRRRHQARRLDHRPRPGRGRRRGPGRGAGDAGSGRAGRRVGDGPLPPGSRVTSRRADLALLLATAIWGIGFPVVKSALADATPLALLTIRFGAATLLLLPFVPLRPRPGGRELAGGLLLGGLDRKSVV